MCAFLTLHLIIENREINVKQFGGSLCEHFTN